MKRNNRVFVISSLIIFISWLPVYLSFYPGVFSYDIMVQTQMLLGVTEFTNQQPVFYTFLWGGVPNGCEFFGIILNCYLLITSNDISFFKLRYGC